MNYKDEVLKVYPDAFCYRVEKSRMPSAVTTFIVECGGKIAIGNDEHEAWYMFYRCYCMNKPTTMNKNLKAGLITVGVFTVFTIIILLWSYCVEHYPIPSAVALICMLSIGAGFIFQTIKSKL